MDGSSLVHKTTRSSTWSFISDIRGLTTVTILLVVFLKRLKTFDSMVKHRLFPLPVRSDTNTSLLPKQPGSCIVSFCLLQSEMYPILRLLLVQSSLAPLHHGLCPIIVHVHTYIHCIKRNRYHTCLQLQ